MKIIFYGATWCPHCRRSKKFLDERKVDYTYINLEETPDTAAEVEKINKGMQSIPTIVFPDGTILTEPSNEKLLETLMANHIKMEEIEEL